MAVRTHQANHPGATHVCQDLQQANFLDMPDVDGIWASPCCQGHAKARGKDKPGHDQSRATAWAVIAAVEAKRPSVVVVENVEEFQSWELYRVWRYGMQSMGYAGGDYVLDAADFGVPQRRSRLFMVWSRSTAPLELKLPAPKAHVPVATVLNWDEKQKWTPIDKPGRSEVTLRRVQDGVNRFGASARFLISYYSSGSGLKARSLQRPCGAITTRARWGVIDAANNRMRMLSVKEAQACMGFPGDYVLPRRVMDANRLLGNAVCPPVAAAITTAIQAAA